MAQIYLYNIYAKIWAQMHFNKSKLYNKILCITIHLQFCILRPLHPELDFVIYKNAPNLSTNQQHNR